MKNMEDLTAVYIQLFDIYHPLSAVRAQTLSQ
jgi:hypothetical protein